MPKPEENNSLVIQMHEYLGHFGEQRVLTKICKQYFLHNRTEDVKVVANMCQHCQMVEIWGSFNFKMKN